MASGSEYLTPFGVHGEAWIWYLGLSVHVAASTFGRTARALFFTCTR